MLNYRLYRVTTGDPIGLPIYAEGNYRDSLSTVGSGTHKIVIPTVTKYTQAQWKAATAHWWAMLAVMWDDEPLYFGIIQDKTWDYWSQTLTLKTVTIDDFWRNRYTFGVGGGYNLPAFKIVAQSMRAALAATINRVNGGVWGGTWPMPLDFNVPLAESGTFSLDLENHDWKTGQSIIDNIQARDGAPDVAYLPKITADGKARWDVLIGSPRIPGPSVTVPLSVRRGRALSPVLHEAGGEMVSGMFTPGEGTGKIRPHGEAGFIDGPAMAVRDAARTISDVDDDDALNDMAMATLVARRRATRQHDFGLVIDDGPNALPASAMRLGTRINLLHSGDGYEPPFTEANYIVAISHSSSSPREFTPEVQPA